MAALLHSASTMNAIPICAGTLIKRLMGGPDAPKLAFSVSHTTRKPRPGETNDIHYHFTTREEFEAMAAAGQFLETAEVHGNLYGTSKAAVQEKLAAGKSVVLDVDVQGARQIRQSGLPALFVFIAPPSLEELERRLRGRGTETPNSMDRRIQNARLEISRQVQHRVMRVCFCLCSGSETELEGAHMQAAGHKQPVAALLCACVCMCLLGRGALACRAVAHCWDGMVLNTTALLATACLQHIAAAD